MSKRKILKLGILTSTLVLLGVATDRWLARTIKDL